MDRNKHVRNSVWKRVPLEERIKYWAEFAQDRGEKEQAYDLLEAAEWIKWAKLDMPLDKHKKI